MLAGALVFGSFQIMAALACYRLARGEGVVGFLAACVLGISGLIFTGFLFMSMALTLQSMTLLVVALICLAFRQSPRSFSMWSIAATVAVFAYVGMQGPKEFSPLRDEYPFESMSRRLEYESSAVENLTDGDIVSHPKQRPAAAEKHRPTQNRPEVWDSYGYEADIRSRSLRMVHANQVEQFIQSAGFGVGRQIRPSRWYVELDSSLPIPQPMGPPDNRRVTSSSDQFDQNVHTTDISPDERTRFDSMHQSSVLNFVNRRGFGYVKDRDHVAGFQSHRFVESPEWNFRSERWLFGRVELVSLLKFDAPAVYLSENLPDMSQLDDHQVRPLDRFEKEALARLRDGEDVIVEATQNRIYMLGSLRAKSKCLECHSGQLGRLLGAFSYEFRSTSPRRRTAAPDGPAT